MARAPRILFVNQHYWPDVASTGQHLTDLAEHLAAAGHDVSVLCGRGKYLAGDLEAPAQEVHNGVTIHRVRTTSFGRGTHVGRIIDYATFYAKVLLKLVRRGRYDFVVTLTTPPLLSYAGSIARSLAKQRYGIWSMDLHPDAEEAMGMIRSGSPMTRLLHALNDRGYRNASFIVDLGTYMKARIAAKGVDPDRLHTIPVWSKKKEIRPVPRAENPLAQELELGDRFVVMYSGNAGLAHRFDEVLEVMRRLKDRDDLLFLFVGGGPQRDTITEFARAHGVGTFRYLDYFPRDQLEYSLSLADAHLLTLRSDMAGIAVPGKLYGIMAAGRPVLMVGPEASEPAQTILDHDLGRVIDPDGSNDPAGDLERAILELKDRSDLRQAMGENGRATFLKRYEAEVACDAWKDLLERQLSTLQTPTAV